MKIYLFFELDVADQDLLLALLAIARAQNRGDFLYGDTESPDGLQLWNKLQLQGYAATQPTLMITTTGFELLREIGKTAGGKNYRWLNESLQRLSLVSFRREICQSENSKKFFSFNLLSVAGIVGSGVVGDIRIALNPMSAQAILGNEQGFVMQHREERAQLQSDEAKCTLSVLCGLVDIDKQPRRLSLDTLLQRVYAQYDDVVPESTIRSRRSAISTALHEIDLLDGWCCEIFGRGKNTSVAVSRTKTNVGR